MNSALFEKERKKEEENSSSFGICIDGIRKNQRNRRMQDTLNLSDIRLGCKPISFARFSSFRNSQELSGRKTL